MSVADFSALDQAGLNLQAVFNLDGLPDELVSALRQRFDPENRYRQLILIGHAGKALWQAVKRDGVKSENPIDDFSVRAVEQWFDREFSGCAHEIVYPGEIPVGLQALGTLAGWHHPSPLKVGIHQHWGTWYAYRVVLLAASDFSPSQPESGSAPCDACPGKACISSCPAGALDEGALRLEKCVAYRKSASSLCKTTCIARCSCPVGSEHRYDDEQIRHTYTISMQAIDRYF